MPSRGRINGFLVAATVSNIGSWATLIALWGVAQYHFDVGAMGVTALAIGWSLPTVLLAPLVGVSIDRFGPARVLLAAQLAQVAVLGVMIASTTFAQLAVLATVGGVGRAFMDPATMALPPRLVGDERLPALNGAVRMTGFLAIVIGPAVGGFAIDWFGFDGAFVVDMVSFGVGIVGLALLPWGQLGGRLAHRPSGWVADAREGWEVIRASATLRGLVLATTAISTLYGSYIVLEPLYVRHVLDRSASTYAWLQSSFGITLVLAGAVAMRHAQRLATLRVCTTAALASCVAAVVYLATTSVVIAFVGVALWGATTAFFSSPSATLLHRNAPGEAHGRVLAFERMIDAAIKLAGTLTAGLLAAGVGIRAAAMVFAGVALGLSVTALGLPTWHRSSTRSVSPRPATD